MHTSQQELVQATVQIYVLRLNLDIIKEVISTTPVWDPLTRIV